MYLMKSEYMKLPCWKCSKLFVRLPQSLLVLILVIFLGLTGVRRSFSLHFAPGCVGECGPARLLSKMPMFDVSSTSRFEFTSQSRFASVALSPVVERPSLLQACTRRAFVLFERVTGCIRLNS
jgi:hypothetical protein